MFLAVCAVDAQADQRGDATLVVTVRDAGTAGPLDHTSVALSGPISVSDATDVDGEVRFEEIPPGDYEVHITLAGYTGADQRVHVDPGALVRVVARLAQSRLRTLGIVTVRASTPDGAFTNREGDAADVLEPDPLAALGTIPGLALSGPAGQPAQPGSGLYASIDGHAPSETGLALDGVPLSIPGSALSVANLDFDLIKSATVTYGAAGPDSAGTLGLRTLDPATEWQTQGEASFGPFGRAFGTVSERGTAGRLGVAVQYATRSYNSPLGGTVFGDASGLTYSHDGDATSDGGLVKLRYAAGSNVATATALRSRTDAALLCTIWVAEVPCGYGPGNHSSGSFDLLSLVDRFGLGRTSWSASAFHIASRSDADFSNLLVERVALPGSSTSSTSQAGFTLAGQIPLGATSANLNLATDDSTADEFGGLGSTESSERTKHFFSLAAGDRIQAGKKSSVRASVEGFRISGLGTAADATLTLTTQHSAAQSSQLELTYGGGASEDGSQGLLSSPLGLLDDCSAGIALGTSPGDPSELQIDAGARYTYNAVLPRGELTFAAYAQDERDGAVTALISAAALPPATFPPGYFQAAREFGALPVNCGPAFALSPRETYLSTVVSGVHEAFQGTYVRGKFTLTHALSIDANVSFTRAAAWSTDPRLTFPASAFRSGGQIPGVPLLSGYATATYSPPSAPYRFYVGTQYAGYDNVNGLPPNVRLNLALLVPVRHGEFVILLGNALDAYPGSFSTARYARPYLLADGAALPGIAQPYEPRRITLSYAIATGRDAKTESSTLGSIAPSLSDDDTLVPGTQIVRWPSTRPPNAFLRNTGAKCGAAERRLADGILEPLQTLVRHLDGRTRPQTESTLPSIGQFEVGYRPIRGSYVLTLETTKANVAQAMFSCALVHVGIASNAAADGLPFPAAERALVSATFYYTPQVGIYFVQPVTERQKFRLYQLPATPPSAPFALELSAVCLPELKPIAATLLAELHEYFTPGGHNDGLAPDWTIAPHGAGGNQWFELKNDAIGAQVSIVNCGHVASASRAQLQALGLGGVAGTFNYSQNIGLYIVSDK